MTDVKTTKAAFRKSPVVLLVIVALAVGVAALAVHFGRQGDQPDTNRQTNHPPQSLAEQVRTAVGPLMQAGHYAAAKELMSTYVSKYPDDTVIRPLLAKAQMALGENQQAELTVDEVIRRSPRKSGVLWLKGELVRRRGQTNYMSFFRKAVEEAVDATPETWSQFGSELLAAGQSEEAARWLSQAFDNGCKDGETAGALGEAKLLAKDYARAQQMLQIAVEKKPNNAHFQLLLAQANRYRGQLDLAADIIESTLVDHVDAELYMELGEIRQAQNRPLDAVKAFVEAADFTEYRGVASLRAARLLYEQRQFPQASEQIEHAYKVRPLDKEVQDLRAKIQKETGNRQQATGNRQRQEGNGQKAAGKKQ